MSLRAAGSHELYDERPPLNLDPVLSFLFIAGLTIALLTVDFLSCPRCAAGVAADPTCEHRGQDGMVTIIRYFYYLGFAA